jgi:hypothetical protein
MYTFVFIASDEYGASCDIFRCKLGDKSVEEKAQEIAHRLGLIEDEDADLTDADIMWVANEHVDVTTHYGLRKVEDAE